MPYTKQFPPLKNPWYPRFESDYADALIEELSEAQCLQLYGAVQSMTYPEWTDWMSANSAAIALYDASTANERAQALASIPGSDGVMLHYACVYSELFRIRFLHHYGVFPERLGEPVHQRDMLRAAVLAYQTIDVRCYWPFEYPENADPFPFKVSD